MHTSTLRNLNLKNQVLKFKISTLDDPEVELCHNLRPSRNGKGLESVGSPTVMPLASPLPGGHLLPGGRLTGSDGRQWLMMEHEGDLVCSDGVTLRRLHSDGGKPCAIISSGERYLVLMGGDAAPMWLYADDDGMWDWRSAADFPEPLAILRKDESTVTAKVGGVGLRGDYNSRSVNLTEDDRATVSRLVADAYCSVGLTASRRHAWFQPVVARYSLVGHDGTTLYTSAPVMVSPRAGQQLLSVVFTLSGSNFSVLSEETLSVLTFSLRLRPTAPLSDAWRGVVGGVRLHVSPQLHPFDGSLHASARFGTFTATAGSLTVRLPGVNDDVTAQGGHGSRLRILTESLLAQPDNVLSYCGTARFDSVGGAWEGLETPFGPSAADPMDEIGRLKGFVGGIAACTDGSGSLIASISAPHSLCAEMGDVCGDTVAYTGLSAKHFGGWLPSEFTVETAEADPDTPQTAPVATKVTFADGSTSVRSGVARDFPIGAFSALLTYPSADAVRMELFCGKSYLSVDLRPDPSGRYSYWLSPTGAPVVPEENRPAFILPAGSPRQRRLPGCVAVASASAPLSPLVMTQVEGGRMVSLRAAPSTNGGWDAGSARFYLFGEGGTRTLTVSSSRRRLTARLLDRRPVGKPDAVCAPGDSSLLVLAGEDLVRISGQRVATLRSFVGADRVGWSPRRREVVCFHSPESPCPENYLLPQPSGVAPLPLFPGATVVDAKGRLLFTRSCPEVGSLLSDGVCLLALDDEGRLHDFSAESTVEPTEVAYRSVLDIPEVRAAHRHVALPILGRVSGGSVEIHADNGAGITRSDILTTADIRGELTRIPIVGVFMPARSRLLFCLTAQCRDLTLNP